jgi:hypothetical protein
MSRRHLEERRHNSTIAHLSARWRRNAISKSQLILFPRKEPTEREDERCGERRREKKPYCPVCSLSLYRLSCPGYYMLQDIQYIFSLEKKFHSYIRRDILSSTEVTEFVFNLPNSSGHTRPGGFIQPLT